MKKLLIGLFIIGMSTQVFAKIKVKDVIGNWNYIVHSDQGELTGIIKITKVNKKELAGEVITDEGTTIPLSKMEIKEGDILYFEVQPEYEIIKISLKIEGDKFDGTGGTDQGEVRITGEKQK